MTDQEPIATEPDAVVASQTPRFRAPAGMALILFTTVLLFASFLFIEPALKSWSMPARRPPLRIQPEWSLLLQQRAMEAATLAWFFMLGASMGSFLHCVAYRLPRGISVVARGSACPGCGTPIHLWHNVPVFGWLWLRGRCAKCGWEIPARYALTELVFGIVFVVLMTVELIGGGLNLLVHRNTHPLGVLDNIWDPNWKLIGVYAWHVSLLTFLLTCCLFAWDRFRLPNVLVAMALLAGIVVPVAWLPIQVVGWDGIVSAITLDPRLRALLGCALGAVAGLFLGFCLVRRTPGNVRAGDPSTTIFGMVLVGLYLGWQAVVAVAALTVVVRAFLFLSGGRNWPVIASITLATTVHLVAWKWLSQLPVYPGLHGGFFMACGAIAATVLGSLLLDGREEGGDAGPAIVTSQPAPQEMVDPTPEPTEQPQNALEAIPTASAEENGMTP